ncbi:hypothetical protein F5X97DRAFT_159079 [Nemania serpens]|nr:hypothetical protein F5X97DRAFT_159079 [Nemania serpens]
MARPRKRRYTAFNGEITADGAPSKKKKKQKDGSHSSIDLPVQHPVLSQYYPLVQSLRKYIIAQLPSSSRIRRRKISAVGIVSKYPDSPLSDVERSLGCLLDTTLVGFSRPTAEEESARMDGWKNFSQRGNESYVTLSNGVAGFAESQALIVEYAVKTIFNRDKSAKWPDHLLCDGFRRNGGLGLRAVRANPYVESLQQSPWPQLLALLGESGERIMIDLLLDCAIFVSVDAGASNVCQISGRPLSNIAPYRFELASEGTPTARLPPELVFVRNRMLYSKPALNNRGQVQFGIRHIHVLNRSPFHQLDEEQEIEMRARLVQQNEAHTHRVMMYMFPRQFGLHNVFTSKINPKETSQRLKDYTLREEEIFEKFGQLRDGSVHVKIPKRLRGHARILVHKLQVLHQRCSYSQLLQHYCPCKAPRNFKRWCTYRNATRTPQSQHWQPRLLKCRRFARLYLRKWSRGDFGGVIRLRAKTSNNF